MSYLRGVWRVSDAERMPFTCISSIYMCSLHSAHLRIQIQCHYFAGVLYSVRSEGKSKVATDMLRNWKSTQKNALIEIHSAALEFNIEAKMEKNICAISSIQHQHYYHRPNKVR